MKSGRRMRSVWHFGALNWKDLGKGLWREVKQDRIMAQSAQLSFYFLLSVFPLLLALMAVVGIVLQANSALLADLEKYLRTIAPESVATMVVTTLQETAGASNTKKVSFGLLGTLWVASSGIVAIIEALNIVYDVPEARPWWRRRLVALVLTVGFLLLIFLALVLLLYGPRLVDLVASHLGLSELLTLLWVILEWIVVLGCVLMAFNILYIYAPNVKHHRWHWLMPGTVLGVGLWLLASFGFKLYLGYFNRYALTYGSLGAVIILLLWFYLTGIAILLGAEFNAQIERAQDQAPKPRETKSH